MAQENAARLIRIWSMWMPERFAPVSLRFAELTEAVEPGQEDRDLMLFSGGVDSSYNLLRRHDAGLKQTLLTVHGLDYKVDDAARFADLLDQTRTFIEMTGSDRLTVKTNAYTEYRKFGMRGTLTHGFILASCLFLARNDFRAGEISADYSRIQEFLVFPYGANSITNPYFTSADFRMDTACLDLTRSQKMSRLLESPEAMASLSFCKNYSARPHNCGRCTKCMRTKLMFIAECGHVPEIFRDRSVSEKLVKVIDLRKRTERAFLLDLVDAARRNDTMQLIPGLEKRFDSLRDKSFLGAMRRVFS
ncbi:MAG TPA: hypothetical protein VLA52_14090 [Thermohalobaculum sp.]|nr:hypothetical protein [Thermohalobaculum sp.]